MARSPRGVTFFACAKKVTKESTPQAARPALRSGSASEPGIFVRHIHVPYENAAHPGRRPSGFTWPARRASWGPGSGSKGKVKSSARVSICQARLVGPLRSGSPGGSNPAGAAHRTCAVFGRGRKPRPKIPAGTAHPPRSGGRTAGVCFFCLLFFAQAKKSRAPAASGTMPNRPPCLSKPTNATDVRIALTANAPAPREVPVAGLRCPSPQPLSPTGTSFGRRRERGFKTQALFCGRIWHTAWHITSTRPASSRTSPARNNCVRVRSTKRA